MCPVEACISSAYIHNNAPSRTPIQLIWSVNKVTQRIPAPGLSSPYYPPCVQPGVAQQPFGVSFVGKTWLLPVLRRADCAGVGSAGRAGRPKCGHEIVGIASDDGWEDFEEEVVVVLVMAEL